MIVLGINSYHANSSAALVVDGELVFAIEEERLNRIKNSAGFPKLAIEECLKYKNNTYLISKNSRVVCGSSQESIKFIEHTGKLLLPLTTVYNIIL